MAYYSGKIEVRNRECFVGGQKIDCPGAASKSHTLSGDTLDVLPPIAALDKRSDFIFTSILALAILGFAALAILKIKIFGKTLSEYLRPVWYFILVSVLAVFWQYLFGLKTQNPALPLQISQWTWEAMVALSAYKLSKIPGFSYGHMFFLGIIYSAIIHGLKITIRYYFYDKTLLYVLDRFLYGSILVMVFAFVLGSVFVWQQKRKIAP